ncbi:discoidin domain-containing protein [Bradyrhizobium sp. HKCCYLS2038]|uniref:discoidin domain-containing protein n=1 Tax=Bradyrhizobium sp. HKCCYLS2038 TaxID=3420764 RepID=UPI003EB963F5
MTVASEVSRSGPYIGNGVTTIFNYGFRILDESHLKVIRSLGSAETVLTLHTDYIVSDVGAAGGGQIALVVPPTSAQTVTILRDAPFTQEIDLENQGPYFADTIEGAFDLAAMRDQQLSERLDRAVVLPASNASFSLEALIADIIVLASNLSAINAVAAIPSGNVSAVAGVAASIPAVAAATANIAIVAPIAANVTSVAGVAANIPAVAANVTDINNFSKMWLGSKSTDPSTDNQGGALQNGALYWNTTDRAFKSYDGTSWNSGAVSDTDRRNAALALIYQAKLYGLTGIGTFRRVLNQIADGFTTIGGINTGASSNYRFDNILGIVGPVPGFGASQSAFAIASSTSSGSAGQTVDGVLTTGWISGESGAGVSGVSWIGQNFGAANAKHIRQIIIYQGSNGDATYSVTSGKVQWSDNGSSWTDHSTITLLATQSRQVFALAASGPHQYWRILANSAAGAANRWAVAELTMSESADIATAMVLTTIMHTADANVNRARALIEFDNSANPTVGTDVTVELTCNGGTNWHAATIASVSTNGQSGRKIIETVDQACTVGTLFGARIKTFNGKDFQMHGLQLAVH